MLIKCSECSKEVSDKAAACPHCGAPVTAKAATPAPETLTASRAKAELGSSGPQRNTPPPSNDVPFYPRTQDSPVPVYVVKPKSNTWKWVIGVPVGLVIAFLIFGALIPENVARANRLRRVCETELMPKGQATQYDCDKLYTDAKYAK